MKRQTTQRILIPKPNEKSLFYFLLTMVLVMFILIRTPADPDMWWHLSSGRVMVESQDILREDVFSFTRASEDWINAFWLPDLFLYLNYELGGFPMIAVQTAVLAVIMMAVVYLHSKSLPAIRIVVILLATLSVVPFWSPRPQLFSLLLVAFLDYFLSSTSDRLDKWIWILVPLFVLWSNLHGGFIFGFLLLAASIVSKIITLLFSSDDDRGRNIKTLVKLLVFSGLGAFAVGLNPYGLKIWNLPFTTIDVSLQIQEWQSPDFHQINLHPFLWLLFLLITSLGFSSRRIRIYDLIKILGFTYMAFYSQRSIPIFVVITAPVTARYLNYAWDEFNRRVNWKMYKRLIESQEQRELPAKFSKVTNITLVSVIFVAALFRIYTLSKPELIYQSYPKNAVHFINTNQPEGRIFNSYNWGGYLTWDLPDYPVYIDGRADLYGDEIINEWRQVVEANDEAINILDTWGINLVLIEPGWPINKELQRIGWSILYQDNISILYERP